MTWYPYTEFQLSHPVEIWAATANMHLCMCLHLFLITSISPFQIIPQDRNIGMILAASYFDEQTVRTVANRTGAEPVVLPLFVGGAPGTDDYFKLVDCWIDGLLTAAGRKGLVGK